MLTFAEKLKLPKQNKSVNYRAPAWTHLGENEKYVHLLRDQERKQAQTNADKQEGSLPYSGGDFNRVPFNENINIRTKLKVNTPGDKYEQEADRVADHIMEMPEPNPHQQSSEDHQMRMKAISAKTESLNSGDTSSVSPSNESNIRSSLAGGRAFNDQERSFFESNFGADFSNVRIHTGPSAANAATAIGARAFTIDNHIVMSDGEYNFNSSQGKQLMVHELTHVLQNRNPDTVCRNPFGAAEGIAAAALAYQIVSHAVEGSGGGITWHFDRMDGVLLPGGRTSEKDFEDYRATNPNLNIERKELILQFWYGSPGEKKAGIEMGLAFNTDGYAIGNILPRIIEPYCWSGWGADCTIILEPQTLIGGCEGAIIEAVLTIIWKHCGLFNWCNSGAGSKRCYLENGKYFYDSYDYYFQTSHKFETLRTWRRCDDNRFW